MAEPRDRDLSKVLSNVEQELHGALPPASSVRTSASAVESFAPQKYRNPSGASDSLEQIQQDFRKAVADLESRFKALADELKRITS